MVDPVRGKFCKRLINVEEEICTSRGTKYEKTITLFISEKRLDVFYT